MKKQLTIEQILTDRSVGRMQSVGQMQVIPILGEDDDTFAPPDLDAGTSAYGEVHVRNRQGRPTIVPPGAAWIVKGAAQDHAIGIGALVAAEAERKIEAMCVQQNQPGLIRMERHAMQILPARLRVTAIDLRDQHDYSKLWSHLSAFKSAYGLRGLGNLVDFLRAFERELETFVAEFELVPDQIGAIVLVGGKIAGLELAPSAAYWAAVWNPLIRICYGSLALRADREPDRALPETRTALAVHEASLAAIEQALDEADAREDAIVRAVITTVADLVLVEEQDGTESLGDARLQTVAGGGLVGQILTREDRRPAVKFASLVAARA